MQQISINHSKSCKKGITFDPTKFENKINSRGGQGTAQRLHHYNKRSQKRYRTEMSG